LAAVDRGASGGDPAKEEQIRRYQESATRQQAELDRVTLQAKRMGCDSSGFFSLFNGQSAQCGPVNNQIQQMRGNLDQITTSLERLRSGGIGGADRENQRRSVLTALAQNNCGPQYANAARGPGSFIDNLFGNNNNNSPAPPGVDMGPQSGTFRTVCVRTCDGFYFPVSYATSSARFAQDEKTCQKMCPAAEVMLFSYRTTGEDITQATSVGGQPYTSLPNALKYRTEFNPSCSCKRPGQTWADALPKDEAVEPGDVVVTEERAKQMAQPPAQKSQTKGKQPAAQPANAAPAATPAAPASAEAPAADSKKGIRAVGPTFIAPATK
jgi:hypothetical protein